jgi:hypothetical protein
MIRRMHEVKNVLVESMIRHVPMGRSLPNNCRLFLDTLRVLLHDGDSRTFDGTSF